MALVFENSEGFDWDEGNTNKNWHLHGISDVEAEEIFYNRPIVVTFDKTAKIDEKRFIALGRTNKDRRLFVAFTMRSNLIRVISARQMTKSDERRYEEKAKRDTRF